MIAEVYKEFIGIFPALQAKHSPLHLYEGSELKNFVFDETLADFKWVGDIPDKFPFIRFNVNSWRWDISTKGNSRAKIYDVTLEWITLTPNDKSGMWQLKNTGEQVIEDACEEILKCKRFKITGIRFLGSMLDGVKEVSGVVATFEMTELQ